MTQKQKALFEGMLAKSFQPADWFHRDDDSIREDKRMWVYLKSDNGVLWTVGFYEPNGLWHADSDHSSREAAAERVHWLNGGNRE